MNCAATGIFGEARRNELRTYGFILLLSDTTDAYVPPRVPPAS